jgi:putative serine protease PepD
MTDSPLWSTPDPDSKMDRWRPERPDGARHEVGPEAPAPAAPRRSVAAVASASDAPTKPEPQIDVGEAAERVRAARGRSSEEEPARRAAAPAPGPDPADAPTRVQGQERPRVDVAGAAERVRARQQSGDGFNGSGFEARSRPSSYPAAPDAPRGWLAPALSAAVAALIVVVAFLLFFRGGDGGGSGSAQAPLPATAGPGGRSADARTIYARASDSVVSVVAQVAGGRATGTGFVIDHPTLIVTNAHVVGDATNVQVRFGDQGRLISARVLGKDVSSDLAVLRLPGGSSSAQPLPLADSRDVRVGDGVVAIGNPFGLDRTATAGIVSATGRHIQAPNGFDIDGVIQTDAPINPGNSGGPLIDGRGRVIGVNSQIATATGSNGNVGIGFAVPSNTVRTIVPQLEKGQKPAHPFLGVSTTADPSGAKVVQVVPSGPADAAGLRAGDVITALGSQPVHDPSDVATAVASQRPGDTIQVEIVRGGVHQTIDVRLANRPSGG